MDWFTTAFNYGVPTGVLLLILYGGFRILQKVGAFTAPLVKDIAAKHMQMIDTMETVGTGLLQQQQAQTALMEMKSKVLDAHGNTLETIGGQVKEIHRAVVTK